MQVDLRGQCLCGGVRYRVVALPDSRGAALAHCHCSMCRKFHGAAFSTFLETRQEDVLWEGDSKRLLRAYVAPNGTRRQFCGECGSSLTFEAAEPGDRIEIALATLDTPVPECVEPDAHIFVGDKAPWVAITDGLPQHHGDRPVNGASPCPPEAEGPVESPAPGPDQASEKEEAAPEDTASSGSAALDGGRWPELPPRTPDPLAFIAAVLALPPRHTKAFRPSELAPGLFLGGERQFAPHAALAATVKATGLRLLVQCNAMDRAGPLLEAVSLADGRRRPIDSGLTAALHPHGSVTQDRRGSRQPVVGAAHRGRLRQLLLHTLAGLGDGEVLALRLALVDNAECDILATLSALALPIAAVWAAGHAVGVHCAAGVSRSSAMVCAMLCALGHQQALPPDGSMPLSPGPSPGPPITEAVLRLMQKRRICVNPNPGFRQQLAKWWARHPPVRVSEAPQ